MSFGADMGRVREQVRRRNQAVFHTVVFSAHRSIVEGSDLTGSPGQPVRYGALRQSYQIEILSPTRSRIASALKYARSIEDGVSYAHGGIPLTPPGTDGGKSAKEEARRSKVGGFHSIERTVLNFDRLVDDGIARVGRSPAFSVEAGP